MSYQGLDEEALVELVQKYILEYFSLYGDEGMVEIGAHEYERSQGACIGDVGEND